MTTDEENVKLIRFLNDVVNGRQYDRMDDLFGQQFTDHNPAWSVRNLDELKQIIRAAHEALNMISTQDDVFAAEGGRVVILLTFHGRHTGTFLNVAPTGRQVSWTSIEIYRIVDKKIVERWVQADTPGLLRQLQGQPAKTEG